MVSLTDVDVHHDCNQFFFSELHERVAFVCFVLEWNGKKEEGIGSD